VIFAETPRLLLHYPRQVDLDPIGELWTDPQVTAFIGGPRQRDDVVESFQEYVDDFAAAQARWGDRWWSIVERDSGRFIGLVALLEKEIDGVAEVELNYFLLPSAWDRGYATEAARVVCAYAFDVLELPSLVALISPDNGASQSVAVKVGMRLDRQIIRPGGSVRYLYRLSRPDTSPQPERAAGEVDQRDQTVHGPQTNVDGDVESPALSGEFDGPVATGGGEAVDMRGAQGALYKPSGPVEQHFGDRYEISDVSGEVNLQRTNIRFGDVTGGEINIGERVSDGDQCPVCGQQARREGAKFCSHCGAELHP
jgi:ribosomal-protein-alanine N-acetyltransferase